MTRGPQSLAIGKVTGDSHTRGYSLSYHTHNSACQVMDDDNGPVSDSLKNSLCETCNGLDPINTLAGISTWASGEGRVLGTKDQLKMKKCPLCQLILTAITPMYLVYPNYQSQGSVTCKLNSNPPYFSVRDSTIGSGMIQMKREDAIQARRNAGLGKTKSTQDEGIEDRMLLRPVQRDQINSSLVRSWVDSCIRDHGYHCRPGRHNAPRDDLEIKLFLIDVKEEGIVERVVTGKQEVEYIALSYVWGQVEVLQTVSSNLATLQRHGALDSGNTSIPQVVIDSMALVEAIGTRYLWVDALCIIQDSPDKNEQLQIMDLIYMRAKLTIIAMAGHG
ncbi:hypothetical protein AWENTII_012804 [Aspergillus wentii]